MYTCMEDGGKVLRGISIYKSSPLIFAERNLTPAVENLSANSYREKLETCMLLLL